MSLTKKLAATAAAVLLPAAVAVAATSPSGTFTGTLHSKNGWGDGRPDSFTIEASLKDGKLTHLDGTGQFIPYTPKRSNATAGCGDANTFDTNGGEGETWTITGQVNKEDRFTFKAKNNFHAVVTLKGRFVSATKAKAKFRFYQGHLPKFADGKSTMTGHCDSGLLRVTLKSS